MQEARVSFHNLNEIYLFITIKCNYSQKAQSIINCAHHMQVLNIPLFHQFLPQKIRCYVCKNSTLQSSHSNPCELAVSHIRDWIPSLLYHFIFNVVTNLFCLFYSFIFLFFVVSIKKNSSFCSALIFIQSSQSQTLSNKKIVSKWFKLGQCDEYMNRKHSENPGISMWLCFSLSMRVCVCVHVCVRMYNIFIWEIFTVSGFL